MLLAMTLVASMLAGCGVSTGSDEAKSLDSLSYSEAVASVQEYQHKLEKHRKGDSDSIIIPRLALTYIQNCIHLNERFGDSLCEPGPLYYELALCYRQLGEEEKEYEALCSAAIYKGSERAWDRIDEIHYKKRAEIHSLFREVDEMLYDSLQFDTLLVRSKLGQCYYIKEVYDVGVWGDVYSLSALFFLKVGNRHQCFNYALMAANKGDGMGLFLVDSLFKIGNLVQGENVVEAPPSKGE